MKSSLFFGSIVSPWGVAGIVYSDAGIHQLFFCDDASDVQSMIHPRYAAAELSSPTSLQEIGEAIFVSQDFPAMLPDGTAFQQSVWQALLNIPCGKICTYADIAKEIGRPGAVRAVGNAIGANPIAYLIPCHRVVRKDGRLGGYRWNVVRKLAILRSEGVIIHQ